MKTYVATIIAEARQSNDINQIRKAWKSTKKVDAGLLYAKYLSDIGEFQMAKKVLLDVKRYCNIGIHYYYDIAKLEISLGQLNEAKKDLVKIMSNKAFLGAKELLDKINQREDNYTKKLENTNKNSDYQKKVFDALSLIYLDIHKYNYEEALKILLSIRPYFSATRENQFRYERLMLFLCKQLNVIPAIDNYYTVLKSYINNQIVSYDEEVAKDHIKRHKSDYNGKTHTPIYNDNIDIETIFYEMKNELNEDNFIQTDTVDLYNIYYPGVGKKGEDYLLVITIPNTKQILNMYPIFGTKDISIDDSKIIRKQQYK